MFAQTFANCTAQVLDTYSVLNRDIHKIIVQYALLDPTAEFRRKYKVKAQLQFTCFNSTCPGYRHAILVDHGCWINNCRYCKSPFMSATPWPRSYERCGECNQKSVAMSKNNVSRLGCYNCSRFDFCAKALTAEDICEQNQQCFLCQAFTCRHGLVKQGLCLDCIETFRLGKKLLKRLRGGQPSDSHSWEEFWQYATQVS